MDIILLVSFDCVQGVVVGFDCMKVGLYVGNIGVDLVMELVGFM